MDRSTPTMASLLRDRDAEHFVGREGPLALVDAVLQPVTATMGAPRVLLVHGPGGIGKSTLLREIGRRGEALGWTVIAIDGRGLDHGPTAAADALAAARTAARPLVLIDTFEVVAGLAGHLRTEVLPALPATAVVVIAGRGAPDSEWFRGGWEHLTRAIPLPPFTREEATALLAAAGATDPDVVRRALAWTRGSPLALATIAAADAGEATAMGTVAEADVLRRLAAILVDEESAGRHLDALVVAAFARTFDIELVRALVPDADAGEELAWLAERTFVERHGSAYAIHDLVGHVLRLDLTGRDPELVRDLRRRLADHTHARARRRRQPISLDLAHLIDDPAIRWGFGEGFRTHRLDDVRDGDAEVLHARLEATGDHDHWCRVAPYLRDAPDRVTVLRDHRDRLTGFTVTITPAHAPRCVEDDPLLSAWLAHARRQPDADDTVLWLCATNFEDDPEGRAQGLLGLAGFLKSRLARVRRCYLPDHARFAGRAGVQPCGGGRAPRRARPSRRARGHRVPHRGLRARRCTRRAARRRVRRGRGRPWPRRGSDRARRPRARRAAPPHRRPRAGDLAAGATRRAEGRRRGGGPRSARAGHRSGARR